MANWSRLDHPFLGGAGVTETTSSLRGGGGAGFSLLELGGVDLAMNSGSSTPPMSFMICIIGGKVRAILCRNCAVLLTPLPFVPPFSQTITLSNLILEMARAAVWARLSR